MFRYLVWGDGRCVRLKTNDVLGLRFVPRGPEVMCEQAISKHLTPDSVPDSVQ